MIKVLFFEACQRHSSDGSLVSFLWTDIERQYSGTGRHYHNLQHLDNLAQQLLPLKAQFSSWDAVVFSIAYHDIIYNVLKQNNEERSAAYAQKKLASIDFPEAQLQQCKTMILLHKNHQASDDQEVNLLPMLISASSVRRKKPTQPILSRSGKNMPSIPGLCTGPVAKKCCSIS